MSIDHIFKSNGPLISSKDLSPQQRQDIDVAYQHSEKGKCALVAMSSYYGGDIFEFGSHDLNTFRNLLTAIHLSGMAKGHDTRFYAFDAFGRFPDMGELADYFKPYSDQGDQLKRHEAYVQEHGLFMDKVHLIQGLFSETCTKEFKQKWRQSKHPIIDDSCVARSYHMALEHQNPKTREIGFLSIDCNVWSSYKIILEFIWDMLAANSYVYLDEGLQSAEVMEGWKLFCDRLREKRNLGCVFVRNAGGFGALYRIYPLTQVDLNL